MRITKVINADLPYEELVDQVVSVLFNVHHRLGSRYVESYYQQEIAAMFEKEKIRYIEQELVEGRVDDEVISKGFAGFMIDDKIMLEIRSGDAFAKLDLDQVKSHLKMRGLKLGMLALFTSSGLLYKRIVNTSG